MRVKERKGGGTFLEGEDTVGDLVYGKVFADVPLGGFSHVGALSGVKLE